MPNSPELKIIFERLRSETRVILAGEKLPDFYDRFAPELGFSRETFFDHPLVRRCRDDVLPLLNDSYGHGIEHSKKVAIEAAAIILAQYPDRRKNAGLKLAILGQLAGLLHDTCRLESEHAGKGAELSLMIMNNYPLEAREKEIIHFAIANHEAFTPLAHTDDPEMALLSAAVYDADKFRWGPDNFSTTLWEICDYEEWTPREILAKFPYAMDKIMAISQTFRTEIGKAFGPEFIETGCRIGGTVYRKMSELFNEYNLLG